MTLSKRAGWFGERIVRDRVAALGLALDLGQHASADVVLFPDINPTAILFEVKAQLGRPAPVDPTPAEAALRSEALRQGLGWALVRVVYRKNRTHAWVKGCLPFEALNVAIVDGPHGVTRHVADLVGRALASPAPSEAGPAP